MDFIPQNKLEQKLIQATQYPDLRPGFYRDFIASDIYVIHLGPPPIQDGRVVFEMGYRFEVQTVKLNGKPYIPIFSSLYRLQAALTRESNYLALNALDFLKIARGSEIVLNPGTRYAKLFSKEEIETLLRDNPGQLENRNEAHRDSKVVIGQPTDSGELVSALKRLFKGLNKVKKAYVANLYDAENDDDPRTLIGLEVSDDWHRIISQADRVASNSRTPQPRLSFVRINGNRAIEDYFFAECKPFYLKKRRISLFGRQ